MRIEWDDVALQDRERLYEFLYLVNPRAAEQADAELEKAVARLIDNPRLGKVWYQQARRLLIDKASLLLVYLIDGEAIKILAVAHQREKFPN